MKQIALLVVVGCIASAVASIARHRADDVARLQRQTTALQLYGRDALAADDTRAIISNAASTLEGLESPSQVRAVDRAVLRASPSRVAPEKYPTGHVFA